MHTVIHGHATVHLGMIHGAVIHGTHAHGPLIHTAMIHAFVTSAMTHSPHHVSHGQPLNRVRIWYWSG